MSTTIITTEHFATHDGQSFTASNVTRAVPQGGTADLLLVPHPGSGPEFHVRSWHIRSSHAPILVALYENPIVGGFGDALPIHGLNRTVYNSPQMAVYSGPEVVTPGTELATKLLTAVAADGGVMDNVFFGREWILTRGTNYLLRMTNEYCGYADISHDIYWYLNDVGD